MSNIVKNYLKILEVISSLNIVLNTENRAGRRFKMSDLEVVSLSLPFLNITVCPLGVVTLGDEAAFSGASTFGASGIDVEGTVVEALEGAGAALEGSLPLVILPAAGAAAFDSLVPDSGFIPSDLFCFSFRLFTLGRVPTAPADAAEAFNGRIAGLKIGACGAAGVGVGAVAVGSLPLVTDLETAGVEGVAEDPGCVVAVFILPFGATGVTGFAAGAACAGVESTLFN